MDKFVITYFDNRTQRSRFWQTPWMIKQRVMDNAGQPAYTNDGRPIYMTDENGQLVWRSTGGWQNKVEFATVYDSEYEATAVNALRALNAEVIPLP